jgi:hypothetical protein
MKFKKLQINNLKHISRTTRHGNENKNPCHPAKTEI